VLNNARMCFVYGLCCVNVETLKLVYLYKVFEGRYTYGLGNKQVF
jgi:hypothetical protein